MSCLWLSIEPEQFHTRIMLSQASKGISLKALMPPTPAHPKALAMFLEALVAWYNQPLTAVVDADALAVRHHAEKWADWLGDLSSPQISFFWGAPPVARHKTKEQREQQRYFKKL
ncbi:MAG: hypothetical protein JW841_10690, partial [Deltaproteobacteria bacterium]|nr:hypothetical protein [Deltaproteobacteria bacterium]